MELKNIAKSLVSLFIAMVIFTAGIVGALYNHENGNINYPGSYYEATYIAMGLGVDTVVNATDLILLGWAFGTNNVTNAWGVSSGLYNPDADFTGPEYPSGSGLYPYDGKVDTYDLAYLGKNYSGPPITALVDIQPTTLNLKSSGDSVTAYITFPDYAFLNNIDIRLETVRIDGVYATGFIGWHKVAFDRAQLRDYIAGVIDYVEGVKFYDLTLTVVGNVGGPPFQGSTTITVVKG